MKSQIRDKYASKSDGWKQGLNLQLKSEAPTCSVGFNLGRLGQPCRKRQSDCEVIPKSLNHLVLVSSGGARLSYEV